MVFSDRNFLSCGGEGGVRREKRRENGKRGVKRKEVGQGEGRVMVYNETIKKVPPAYVRHY